MVGMPRPIRVQSSRSSCTPMRPAMALRWITALVEPPMAALTRMAFSNASLVRIFDSFRSSRTISTARMPDMCAST
ncbi:hypothetical protein D3C78_1874890 [compost metagenome]